MPRRRGRHNQPHHQQQNNPIPPPSKPQYSPPSYHHHPPPPQPPPQSSLPNQSHHPCRYKIDLHGMNEQKAISSLARFLEDCRSSYQKRLVTFQREGKGGGDEGRKEEEKWALVITGSGAHSPNGPVLRTAVQSSLTRRQMTYTLTKGRGSFLVNITTGIDFYSSHNSLEEDTKVLVVSEHDACALPLRKQKLPSAPPKVLGGESGAVRVAKSEDPLPAEVLQNEDDIKRAKKLSSLSYNTTRGLQQRDVNNLDNALKESQAMAQEHTLKTQQEEEELQKILELSSKEEKERNEEEEEELLKILELSKLDAVCTEGCADEEEEEMKRVLALSLQQQQEVVVEEDEDVMMKRAIQQSLVMQEEDVNVMEEVMQMSLAAAAAATTSAVDC